MSYRKALLATALLTSLLMSGCTNTNTNTEPAPEEPQEETQTAEAKEPVVTQVENMDITLPILNWKDDMTGFKEQLEYRKGTYTGQLIDGIPDGTGRFESQNPQGDKWYYEGDFTSGHMTGVGRNGMIDDDETFVGHFTDSAFDPTEVEWYQNAIPVMTSDFNGVLYVGDTTSELIEEHPEFFPAKDTETKDKIKNLVEGSIEYRQLSKNVTPYCSKLVYFKNQRVLQVKSNMLWGHTYTFILASDQEGNNIHYITYDGDIDVYDGDNIAFIATPYGTSSFQNIGGGNTNIVAEIASVVIKS